MLATETDRRIATYILCAISTAITLIGVMSHNITVDVGSFLPRAMISMIIVIIHLVFTWIFPNRFLSPMSGVIACTGWCSLMAGVASMAALHHGAPLFDPTLASTDQALGLDTRTFVAWVAERPLVGQLLETAYYSHFEVLCAMVCLLTYFRRLDHIWEYALAHSVMITICGLVSNFFPAIGPFTYLNVGSDILARLPENAGIYYVSTYKYLLTDPNPVINLGNVMGMVTFPSFHACMALASAWAFRSLKPVFVMAIIWNLLVLASTLPIGGHYSIDVISGSCLWAIVTLIIHADRVREVVHLIIAGHGVDEAGGAMIPVRKMGAFSTEP